MRKYSARRNKRKYFDCCFFVTGFVQGFCLPVQRFFYFKFPVPKQNGEKVVVKIDTLGRLYILEYGDVLVYN